MLSIPNTNFAPATSARRQGDGHLSIPSTRSKNNLTSPSTLLARARYTEHEDISNSPLLSPKLLIPFVVIAADVVMIAAFEVLITGEVDVEVEVDVGVGKRMQNGWREVR